MTKREMFVRAIEIVNATDVEDKVEMVEAFEHEIELLSKRSGSAKKPTERQLENVAFKSDILATLTRVDRPLTIKELCAEMPELAELSNQRVSHMLSDLRKEEKVVRTYEKKVPYFSIAD